MADKSIFKRKEMKYKLDPQQYERFRIIADEYMQADKYGLHTICSVYFDNDDDEIIRTSLEKPVYKEKLRMRSYGLPKDDDSPVFLELKKKYKGIVYKRRIKMKLGEAEAYINNDIQPEDSQIFREIDYFRKQKKLYPKVMVAYDRIAMFGKEDKDLRLTFDFNIRCRNNDPSLKSGDSGVFLLPDGYAIMEIKIAAAMPMWMCRALDEIEIYPASFSKYGTYYLNYCI